MLAETNSRESISSYRQMDEIFGISHGIKSVRELNMCSLYQWMFILIIDITSCPGQIDLPAMIDYAIAVSKQSALHYIGHSQGTTSFFVMASLRTDMNAKIKSMHALGNYLQSLIRSVALLHFCLLMCACGHYLIRIFKLLLRSCQTSNRRSCELLHPGPILLRKLWKCLECMSLCHRE